MAEGRAERIAVNETRFREINERLRADLEPLRRRPEHIEFVCECGRLDCRGQLLLTDEEYARVRSDPMQFAVIPGHEIPDTENVVERGERYLVVFKHETVRHIAEGRGR